MLTLSFQLYGRNQIKPTLPNTALVIFTGFCLMVQRWHGITSAENTTNVSVLFRIKWQKARRYILLWLRIMSHRFQLASPDFAGSKINGAFTVELEQYIETSPVEYWLWSTFGILTKLLEKTKCVSNQLGYVFHSLKHHTFNPEKAIEVQ